MYLQDTKEAMVQNDLSLRRKYILRITKGDFKLPTAIIRNVMSEIRNVTKKGEKNQFLLYFHIPSVRKNKKDKKGDNKH